MDADRTRLFVGAAGWVVAAIVTGRPEDFALEGSHENFAGWWVL
jgi:hypothetical protein